MISVHPLHRLRRHSTAIAAALVLLVGSYGGLACAAEVKLADLAYANHQVTGGVVTIGTSSKAQLEISFPAADVARVRIAPLGAFTVNPSPALAAPQTPVAVTVEDAGDTLIVRTPELALHVKKAHLRVDAYDVKTGKPITLETADDGTSWDSETGAIRQSRSLVEGEHIYGLGEDNLNNGMLDRRGSIRDMWTGQQINSGNVTANFPVPFYLSTGADGRGYGVFVDNVWHMRFDLGKTHRDKLTWTAPGGPIDYYIIDGPSFKTVIDRYTQLTGRPTMLPLYALGFWQSRCFFNDFADIKKTVDRFKADGLPLDVLVIDSNWPRVEVDFKWSDAFLSGKPAETWIKGLHDGGAHVMLSTKGPMIRTDADVFADGLAKGMFATDGNGKTLTTGYYSGQLMDFTNPGMQTWLGGHLKPLSQQGVDAWWLDLIEPEGEPPQAVYYAGKSADIHNTFPLLNYRTYFNYQKEIDPTGRPVILGRAASAGTQRYSGIVWTGDITSDWPTFQAHIPEAQNTGMSGLPYWTNDSGGFLGGFLQDDRYGAHAELYARWFEFTTFIPIMRAHKAGPAEPYEYGPEVEAIAKKYMKLRYRLLPYIYTAAHETATTGVPMLRPLVLEFQDDPGSATAETEYMFGSELLVAPVIWQGAVSRQIYFPPGQWISYDDGYEVTGGTTIGVAAPLDRIPLFVRGGAILATAPDMMSSGEKPWDPITLDIWPSGTSTGVLYDDDKSTTAWEKGAYTTTAFKSIEEPGRRVTFTITPSNAQFGPRQWLTRFHLTSAPKSVTVDGKPANAFTFENGTLSLAVPGHHVARTVVITLDGSMHPRPSAPKVDAPPIGETVAAAARQIPQFLPAPILPTRIEAANYDKGGEGLAFHVATPAAQSIYRQDGVPITASSDAGGGYAVPGLKAGDWLAYTLDAGAGGWFNLSARARSSGGGQVVFTRKRFLPVTTVSVPAGDAWTTVPGQSLFYLPAGEQILTARLSDDGIELGNFTFMKAAEAAVSVEAEAGVLTNIGTNTDHPGYSGTGFVAGIGSRASSIDVPITVPAAGNYLLVLRYANGLGEAKLTITLPAGGVTSVMAAPTGDWNDYAEIGVPIDLKAGRVTFRISGTDIGVINIDQIKLIPIPLNKH